MNKTIIKRTRLPILLVVCLSLLALSGCKRDSVTSPSPVGPSTFAIILELSASPNVLFAGNSGEQTTIQAKLRRYDGVALANESIQFHVRDSLGIRVELGYFEGGQSVITKTTNSNGEITVVYNGPNVNEMLTDSLIYIYAMVGWEGDEFITETTPIYIVRDVSELAFEIYADPNILWCSSQNPRSTIKAYFKKADGTPLANRKIFFSVLSGPGNFSDGKTRTYAVTNEYGYASVTYVGPKNSQISADQFVQVRGQPETVTPFWIHEEIDIRLMKSY